MALSRLAREFAAEIHNHDWSDAPFRADRAGHSREFDSKIHEAPQLTPEQTDTVRLNVFWVTAQVLGHADPNFDPYEFAEAAGVDTLAKSGRKSGHITAGLRTSDGRYARPGTWKFDGDPNVLVPVLSPDTLGEGVYHSAAAPCGHANPNPERSEVMTLTLARRLGHRPCRFCGNRAEWRAT